MRHRIALVALPLLALAACTQGDPVARPTTPPAATVTSSPATAPRKVRIVDRREIRNPGAMSVFGDIFGRWAAWASAPTSRSRRFDRVNVADLRTGTTATVVRTATQHIDWVRGDGDTLVYRELSARPDDAETAAWAIKTYDLATKASATIARSRQPGTTVPVPVISDRAIAWIEGEEGAQQLRVYDRTSGTLRTVFRSKVLVTVEVEGSDVYFIDGASEDRPVLTMSLPDGHPTVLIPDAHAILLRVTATCIAYARGPSADGDPDGLIVYDRASRQSAEITTSTSLMFALGDGFIAWSPLVEYRVVVGALSPSTKTVVLQADNLNVPLRLSADGNLVMWGESNLIPDTNPARFTNRVFVARIVPVA